MDRIDKKILHCLQRDASLSIAELAEKVGLSSTPCWRRVRELEKAGVIKGR
nr:winged helix-turn-helix transcriptional regulator [Desulfuromonadales bacterium]